MQKQKMNPFSRAHIKNLRENSYKNKLQKIQASYGKSNKESLDHTSPSFQTHLRDLEGDDNLLAYSPDQEIKRRTI